MNTGISAQNVTDWYLSKRRTTIGGAVYYLKEKSKNQKTGKIPVATIGRQTCPDACPFKDNSYCYGNAGPVRYHWDQVSKGARGGDFKEFCRQIRDLPEGTLWRYGQVGDLPGIGDKIEAEELSNLVSANFGKKGFAYTHKPMAYESNRRCVSVANQAGFRINLSANNPDEVDKLMDLNIAPVVTITEIDAPRVKKTAKGRRIVRCPATYTDKVNCKNCGLCARERDYAIGFPAHGKAKRKLNDLVEHGTPIYEGAYRPRNKRPVGRPRKKKVNA